MGLDPAAYGTPAMRRTKLTPIDRCTTKLRAPIALRALGYKQPLSIRDGQACLVSTFFVWAIRSRGGYSRHWPAIPPAAPVLNWRSLATGSASLLTGPWRIR